MSKEIIDVRTQSNLLESLNLAGDIISKNYLYQLKDYRIIDIPQELKRLDISDVTRIYKFKKVVSDPDESMLDKMVTVFNAAYSSGATVLTLVKGYEDKTEYYLGVVSKDLSYEQDIVSLSESFKSTLQGNFPGVIIEELKRKSIDEVSESLSDFDYITSISSIAALRDEEDKSMEKYVQGIEHLVDSLEGKEYTLLVVSDPVPPKELSMARVGYEQLYTQLSTFQTSTFNFNESETYNYTKTESEGITDTVGESLSQTQNYSSTSGWSESVSTGKSKTRNGGKAFSAGLSAAGVVVGSVVPGVGTLIGAGIGGLVGKIAGTVGEFAFGSTTQNSSTTSTKNFSETKSSGQTTTSNSSKSTSRTVTGSESEGDSKGRSLQFNTDNKTVKVILDKIDKQLERLNQCEALGAFNCAAYVFSENPETALVVASSYNALMRGEKSSLQASYITNWTKSDVQFDGMKEYLKRFSHPVLFRDGFEDVVISPALMVDSSELAIAIGLPKKSIVGLPVIESATFGRNVFTDAENIGRTINLGKIYHMGQKTKVDVDLDVNSLTMHTFVTGSTGAGKSNAIYSLLERVIERTNAHFMVIEPAKGEYKDKFGHLKSVKVYGTNSFKMDMLRINPFSFPSDIHVLEHIDRLIEIFNVCWPMYAAMPAVLKDSIERAYINAGWDLMNSKCKYEKQYGQIIYPSFSDVLMMINIVMNESQYSADSKGDYVGALCTRIKSLTNGIYGQIFTCNELSYKELFDSNVIVDLSRVGSIETKSLIMGLLVMKMQEYRMSSQEDNNSGLKHLTVLEEAHNLLKRTSSEQSDDSSNLLGKSVEMLANSIAEMRTYGEGFIIADQAPGLLDMSVIRNTNTKIILRLPDMSDRELVGKAASLNDEQIVELSKLKTGVAAVYQNNWLEPVLCQINRCKDDEKIYQYTPKMDYDFDEEAVKMELIDYLLLPTPKKLEVKSSVVSKLEKSVFKLPIPANIKIETLRYFSEKEATNIQKMRSRIIFNMFNSQIALTLSNTEKNDMNSWYNLMLDKLEPSTDVFGQEEREKILAIITNENALQEGTDEAYSLRNGYLHYVKSRG